MTTRHPTIRSRSPGPTWELAYDEMQTAGVPLVEREAAWRSWAGWRVNYDAALLALAELTASPTTRLAEGGTYGAN